MNTLPLLLWNNFLFSSLTEEPPNVDIEGSNNGRPVPEGRSVELICIPWSGIPAPVLSWSNSDGGRLPAGATKTRRGERLVLTIPYLDRRTCIDCTGRNPLGTDTDRECIDVLSK